MKSINLFALLILPFLLISQHKEGQIFYTETMKLDMEIPEEHMEELQGLFPESSSTDKVLIFNNEESIYKDVEGQGDDVVEAGSEDSGMKIKMVMSRPDLQLYKNMKDQKTIQKEDLMGRPFLITEDIEKLPWKLVNEAKDILGYTCQKAVINDADIEIIAWYTPQIAVSNGPMHFGQLPGMILEVDIDNGQTSVVATDILFTPLSKGSIDAPDKGKKMSREAFEKLEAEKEKEMQEAYGGSGSNVIIKERRR
jgi:GLPGLI family protein